MEDVPKHTHLFRRGPAYYFRCRVPADLTDHYGKAEIKRSLHATDHRKALELVRVEALKQDQEFAEVRRKLNPEQRATLSEAEIERLAALMAHSALSADEGLRWDGLDDAMFHKMAGWQAEGAEFYGAALARGNTAAVEDLVDEWLAGQGIELAKGSEAYRKLCFAFLKAAVQATEKQAERHRGRVVETPPAPAPVPFRVIPHTPAVASEDNPRLFALFERWAFEHKGKRAAATIPEFRVSIRRFVEVNGDLPVREITKAHVRAFKDAMLRLPSRPPSSWRGLTVPQLLERAAEDPALPRLSATTINDKMLGALSAVLGWAAGNAGYIEYNPAQGMKAATQRVEEERRQPYTAEDLNAIFRLPVFSDGERPQAGAGEAAKWLPLLALFTGARREELGQLLTEDVKEGQGAPYLDLFTIAEGQHRKTQSSRRRVPVHPELVRLGFLAYVQERRKAGDVRLFPGLRQCREKWTTLWGKWWGKYIRTRGLNDPRKDPFHAFRHAVKAAYRLSGVPEVVYDALMGHFPGSVGRSYGGGLTMNTPVQDLAAAVAKLRFPGLDLDHLIPAGRASL